tara:strand:- start:1829 stop:2464 length:636 start_codon:yes stop_codon:yes gene_type:complete
MGIKEYEEISNLLQKTFEKLISNIQQISIGDRNIFPYGWRKSAKGRTVWRLIEEAIVQNLEYEPWKYNLKSVTPAESEVGIFDLALKYEGIDKKIYINIKSSVKNGRKNKDDISKAIGLIDFVTQHPDDFIFIITIEIDFSDSMNVLLTNAFIMPTPWLPDVYVNPSNNGNLQSSKYKDINLGIRRTNQEFLNELRIAKEVADQKKKRKIS